MLTDESSYRLTAVVLMALGLVVVSRAGSGASAAEPVPVGVAKVDITPECPVRMYGYAARKIESEGIAGRLKAAALAIGGDEGDVWITAYTNDVSTYVVSRRLLGEGGYEVQNSLSSMISYGRPEQVEPAMEDRIVDRVRELLPESFRSPP